MTTLLEGIDLPLFTAGQELDQYVFCSINNNKLSLPQAGAYCDGVTLEQYHKDDTVLLRYLGGAKIKCGAEITQGQFLTTDASGCAVPVATGNATLAKALESGTQGQIIQVILTRG